MTSRSAVARSLSLVCFALLATFAGNCDEPPPLYDVASIELIPPNVHVLSGSDFEMSVRLRDSYGRTLPVSFGYEVQWSVGDDAWLRIQGSAGHTARLEARHPPNATTPNTMQIQATVLNRHIAGLATVIPPGFVAPGELILANHQAGDAPNVLLADGQRGTFVHDETVAFVATALLSDFTSSGALVSEVALFSLREELGFVSPVPWAPGPGVVNLTATASPFPGPLVVHRPLASPHRLNVRVWNASGLLPTEVDESIKYVAGELRRNRTGTALNILNIHHVGPRDARLSPCTPLVWLDELEPFRNETVVHLVFVTYAWDAGLTCFAPVGLAGRLIVRLGALGSDHTLLHEMGHALALKFPNGGHTNGMTGFDPTNFMWGSSSNRTYFTLGQLFRMSVDDSSWLNLSSNRTGLVRDCGTAITGTRPCPQLALPSPVGP